MDFFGHGHCRWWEAGVYRTCSRGVLTPLLRLLPRLLLVDG
jgi:hypothetical protein